ncbi:MAG TPA: CapA family protein [Acidimicrobiales bacterium]|nr:CapA family protein [Acidimicrobiales bacterium]
MISARLGAIVALTLAGVTITVAYDRTRADGPAPATSTTVTTVPETAPTIADPSSTVDITNLTPDSMPVTSTTEPSVTSTIGSQPTVDAAFLQSVGTDDRSWSGSGQPVTFMFAGDTQFEGSAANKLAANPSTVLLPMAPVMSQADVTMVNLETSITTRGSPEPKEFTFRAPPTAFAALKAAGVDVVTMANNHGRDFGAVGLQDTLAAIQSSGFPVVGIGANAEAAYAPYRLTVKGQRIAIFGVSRVIDAKLLGSWTATDTQPGLASAYPGAPLDRLLTAVRAARASSDTVVVFLHWGTELMTCPTSVQETLAHQLHDAGADLIVGAHAHRVQGDGMLDGAFVAYGLGNFVWPRGNVGAVIEVTVTGRVVNGYQWIPMQVAGSIPSPMGASQATAQVSQWEQLRRCTDLEP